MEKFVRNVIFLGCLVEFISETILAWSFLCWKVLSYKVNFFNR